MKKIICFFVFLVLVSANALAATVFLKDGREVDGNIVEKTNEHVVVNLFGVNVTYGMDEVDRIQEDASEVSAATLSQPASQVPDKNAQTVKVLNGFFKKKNYEAGVDYLNQIIKESPNNKRAYLSLAIFYYRLGNFEKALQVLDTASSLGSTNNFPPVYRALCYKALGREKEAAESFSRAIEVLKESDSLQASGLLDMLEAFAGSK